MELTPKQKDAIERLYENESLTDNLTDEDAKALLHWAQQQIVSNADGDIVAAAVSAANQSGEEGGQALLGQANAFLARALSAQNKSVAADVPDASAETRGADVASASNPSTAAAPDSPVADAAANRTPVPSPTSHPTKTRRPSKRKKK